MAISQAHETMITTERAARFTAILGATPTQAETDLQTAVEALLDTFLALATIQVHTQQASEKRLIDWFEFDALPHIRAAAAAE